MLPRIIESWIWSNGLNILGSIFNLRTKILKEIGLIWQNSSIIFELALVLLKRVNFKVDYKATCKFKLVALFTKPASLP